jgi:NADH-quinone oxidoreductase subunit M
VQDWPLLTILLLVPLAGVGFVLAVRGEGEVANRNIRYGALWAALVNFVLSLLVWVGFDPHTADFQFVEKRDWFALPGGYTLSYHLGVDGISMFFILLTTLLTLVCVIASWQAITERVREYMIAFLVMEIFMIGTFCALDLVTFYIFFEGVLIPMFLIIGVWGGPRRVYSAFKFFLFTLAGSVLMLLAVFAIYYETGTTDVLELFAFAQEIGLDPELQKWLWLAFFASFAIKVPMWPVHTWLPDAHVEAPTAGSVILAGVLLKMGAYGFLRFSLPILPDASVFFTPLIYTLSAVAIVYTSFVALAQEDMKKLIAYSSVAHMGYVTIGIFTATQQGVEGALIQMLSHGVVSAALFLCVGVVYDRQHSRMIDHYGGLVDRMPHYALVFMVFMLASVGLPGTSGFIGEILVLIGSFQVNTWVALFVASGMVLSVMYMLWLYRRIIFGKLTKDHLSSILDLSLREKLVFAPLILVVLWMGIYPMSFLTPMADSVRNLINNYQQATLTPPAPARQAVASE